MSFFFFYSFYRQKATAAAIKDESIVREDAEEGTGVDVIVDGGMEIVRVLDPLQRYGYNVAII